MASRLDVLIEKLEAYERRTGGRPRRLNLTRRFIDRLLSENRHLAPPPGSELHLLGIPVRAVSVGEYRDHTRRPPQGGVTIDDTAQWFTQVVRTTVFEENHIPETRVLLALPESFHQFCRARDVRLRVRPMLEDRCHEIFFSGPSRRNVVEAGRRFERWAFEAIDRGYRWTFEANRGHRWAIPGPHCRPGDGRGSVQPDVGGCNIEYTLERCSGDSVIHRMPDGNTIRITGDSGGCHIE